MIGRLNRGGDGHIASPLPYASISTTLNIYTHVVDASHRKAIEAVERELFVVLDHSGLQTAAEPEQAQPASSTVN